VEYRCKVPFLSDAPSPQLCRQFWYDTYTVVLEGVKEIAAEQGSSDPQVVMQNYGKSRRKPRALARG
jgi:hypothetical protein